MGIGDTQMLAAAPAYPRLLSLLETSSQEHTAAHPVLESVAGAPCLQLPGSIMWFPKLWLEVGKALWKF